MHISAGDVLCESETISSCHFIFQLIYYLGSVRLAIHHMQWFMLWMHSLCNLLGVCMAAAFRQSICADASAFQQAECSLLACLLSKCRWRIVPQVIFLYWFFAQCGLQSRMQWIPVCFAFSSILCTHCICIVIWKEAFCDAVWEKTIDFTGEYKKGLWETQSAWLCQPSVGGKNVSADSYSFVASLIHNSWNWPFAQGL